MISSSIPTYNVQIDSRYRDIQNYPTATDFAVSFKAPSSTGTYVQGVPINSIPGSTGAASGYFSPLQIDPDFDATNFKVINGTIQNMKAIDANNILACGLIYGFPLTITYKSTILLTTEGSSISNVPVFLIRISRKEDVWNLNWFIFANQGPDYPIETTLNNVTRTVFQIDTQNNIFFAFDFRVPEFDLKIVTPAELNRDGLSAEGTVLYTVKNPTDGLKCTAIFSFDQEGNLNYINGRPWGYHILSSNYNLDPTKENGRFNLEVDTSLSLYVSGNTNPLNTKIYKTVNSVGAPSYQNSSRVFTYTKGGVNYGIQVTSPGDFITNGAYFTTYNLDTTPPSIVKFQNINSSFATGIGPINPFADVKGVDFTSGGTGNFYFFIYPNDGNPFITNYQTFIIAYDIVTDTYTTQIGNSSTWFTQTHGGYGNTAIKANDGSADFIYIYNIVYGPSPYTDPTLSTLLLYSYDVSTPSTDPVLLHTISFPNFIPWNYPINLFNFYFAFDSIVYNGYVYYVVGAITSVGNPSNDPFVKTNIYNLYRYDPVTNSTPLHITFIYYDQATFKFFIKDTKLYFTASAQQSAIFEVVNNLSAPPIERGQLTGGFLFSDVFVVNGSYYCVFNLNTQGIVFNIDDVDNPYILNQTTRYPSFDDEDRGSVNYVSSGVGSSAAAYGLVFDNSSPPNTWFFKTEWIANTASINSEHYNENVSNYLNIPFNYIYSIDTISLNFPNIVSNSLLFNPRSNLNSNLLSWHDASNPTSFVLSGNKIQAWFDLSGNSINFVQIDSNTQPTLTNSSVSFDGASKQFMNTTSNTSLKTIQYSIVVYEISNQITTNLQNIFGLYGGSGTGFTKPIIGIAGSDLNNDVSVFNYLVNQNGQYPTEEYEYNITNGNELCIADFGFDSSRGVTSLFFNGVNVDYNIDNPTITNNFGIGNIYNIGGKQTGSILNNEPGYFSGNIKEIITLKSYPDQNTRLQIQSYLGYKWNINSYISNNNPYKQQLSSAVYNLMITKSLDFANISIYEVTNLQSIKPYDTIATNSTIPLKQWSSIAVSGSGQYQTAVALSDFIYTSDTYGISWTKRFIANSYNSVAISGDGQYQSVTVRFGQIYTSSDYGITWTARDSNRDWSSIEMSDDGQYQTAVVNAGQVYTSNDNGVTWTARDSNRAWSSVAINDDGQYQIAVVNGGKIYTSNDNGVTWTARDSDRAWVHVDINGTGDIQTAVVNGGQIYTSTDYGVNWTARDSNRAWNSVAVSNSGVTQVATVYNGQIYVSTDTGATWTAKDSNRKWTHVDLNSTGTIMSATVENAPIYLSNNTGASWNYVSPIDICHFADPYSTSGGYYIFYLDNSAFYVWRCDSNLQFFKFVGSKTFESLIYQFNCWKIVPYINNSNELCLILTFQNGYAIKYKINNNNTISNPLATQTFNISKNILLSGTDDVLSSGEVYNYPDGKIFFFAMVGSKIYSLSFDAQEKFGYIYFCDITNDSDFIKNTNLLSETFPFGSGNARSTSTIRYQDGTPYLVSRYIGLPTTGFLNISDYTKFVYPYPDLKSTVASGQLYDPPIPWVPIELSSPASVNYNEGLSAAFIPFDMYNNPITNQIYGTLSLNGDYSSFVLPLDDQQFYLSSINYNNIFRTLPNYFPTYGQWIPNNLTNVKNWSGCFASYSGQYQAAVVTGNYIYVSNDFGVTFTANTTTPVAPWTFIAINQDSTATNDGQYMLAVGPNNYVYLSSDYGVTFSPIISVGIKLFIGCAVSSTGQYMTVTTSLEYIYRSDDFGATWTQVATTANWYLVSMSDDGQYQTVTASANYVWRSINYGVTWNPIIGSLPTSPPPGAYFGISMNSTGQYQFVSQVGGYLWSSNNFGQAGSWTPNIAAGLNFWFINGMSRVGNGQYRAVIPNIGKIFVSNDFGVTFIEREDTNNWRSVGVSGNGQYMIASTNFGLLYVSSDFGVTWEPRGNRWSGVALNYNSQLCTVLDKGGYLYTSNDYSTSFNTATALGTKNWERVAINKSSTTGEEGKYQTATVDGGQIFNSANFGVTWTARDSSRAWRGVDMDITGQYQTAVVYGGQIYTSSNYGVSWTARDSNRNWIDVAVSADGVTQTAVVYGGQIYRSTNSGATWTAVDSNRAWYSIAMSDSAVYQTATTDGGQIYRSINSGVNWSAVESNRTWRGIAMNSTGQNQTALVFGGEIYNSSDFGATWTATYESKNWIDIDMSSNGINKVASVDKDLTYKIFSIRMTQLKHASIGQKVYAVVLLTNILNTRASSLVYYVDITNPEFAGENYTRADGSYSPPITTSVTGLEGIGQGFVHKIENEGNPSWITYYGGDETDSYGLYTNISNITIDTSLKNLYVTGGWTNKIQSFFTNSTGTFTQLNQITSNDNGYNGFISKLNIIDGKVEWLTPMIGPGSDFIEKIQYIQPTNQVVFVTHFDSTILLLYNTQISSTGPWTNPVDTIVNLGNTSVETSAVIVLDADSEYVWSTLQFTNEDTRRVTSYDVVVDTSQPSDRKILITGISNSTEIDCRDSSGINKQKIYSNINPTTQNLIYLYGFDLSGNYKFSNRVEFSPFMNINIQDVKSFSNVNQIWLFPNYFTNATDSYLNIYNRDGSLAQTLGVNYIPSGSTSFLNQVDRNNCQPITFKYNPSYVDLNGNSYSRIVMLNPSGLPTETDALTNNSLFIQGPLLSTSTFYSVTTQTLISNNTILNKNFSIRGNFVDIDNFENDRYNIILNQTIDIASIQRTNLPYIPTGVYGTEWQGSVVKSAINSIISYDMSLIPNSQNRLTVTTLYGTVLTTYTSPTQVNQPYYLYFPDASQPDGVKFILVNSVVYNTSNLTYTLTIDDLDDLKVDGEYYGPFLYISKKNVSALYTLQFYPATLRFPRIYYVSISNLIIPNRPIRNTSFPGVRYLTDLPYIYLSVYNTDDQGNFDPEIVNNFFSNNVTKGFNAVFEVPMRYATTPENFVILSTNNKPKIKFTPGFYNIRCTLTDPEGNILLLDNTPYKPNDSSFTGTTVPDSLMNCNISLVFEPTEIIASS